MEEALELLDPVLGLFKRFLNKRVQMIQILELLKLMERISISFVLYEDYYMYHTDPKIRRAYDKFNEVLTNIKYIATFIKSGGQRKTIATMRGYDSLLIIYLNHKK